MLRFGERRNILAERRSSSALERVKRQEPSSILNYMY